MRKLINIFICVISGGCSPFLMERPPQEISHKTSVECTESYAAPVVDTATFALAGVGATAASFEAVNTSMHAVGLNVSPKESAEYYVAGGLIIASTAFLVSAIYGYNNADKCSAAKIEKLILDKRYVQEEKDRIAAQKISEQKLQEQEAARQQAEIERQNKEQEERGKKQAEQVKRQEEQERIQAEKTSQYNQCITYKKYNCGYEITTICVPIQKRGMVRGEFYDWQELSCSNSEKYVCKGKGTPPVGCIP